MTQTLAGKVVLITGASSGIGRAMAHVLARQSARLAVRSAERLVSVREASRAPDTLVLPTDLSVPALVDAMVTSTLAHFSRIDIFLANAAPYMPGEAVEGDSDAWDAAIAANVNGVFGAVRAVLPSMIAQGGGDMLVTSSISGH